MSEDQPRGHDWSLWALFVAELVLLTILGAGLAWLAGRPPSYEGAAILSGDALDALVLVIFVGGPFAAVLLASSIRLALIDRAKRTGEQRFFAWVTGGLGALLIAFMAWAAIRAGFAAMFDPTGPADAFGRMWLAATSFISVLGLAGFIPIALGVVAIIGALGPPWARRLAGPGR